MARGKAIFRASTRGAGRVGRKLSRTAQALNSDLRTELRALSERAEETFRDYAPEESGRLREGIEAVPSRRAEIGYEIHAEARNPDDGFDYVAVTRFGHRTGLRWIYPSRSRALRLRERSFGRVIYAGRVRAYHPSRDWAEVARPAVDREGEVAEQRAGRRIRSRLL